MTLQERADRVRELGYTEREARFVAIAALHSGYFLRRQFTQAVGVGSGKAANTFTAKLLRSSHASVVAVCHNAHLFHLCSKLLYERLGIPNSRNRRPRAPFAVKSRLMGLDYVLAHATTSFFGTYVERVTFFCDVLGLDRAVLPTKFVGQGNHRRPRYFTDGFPLGLDDSADGSPMLTFCYVDDGGSSVSAFQTYLAQYRPLLRTLTTPARLVYIADTRRHFHPARVVFDHFLDEQAADRSATGADLVTRLAAYFRVRQLYESRQFNALTKEAMDLLRDGRDTFRGDPYDEWFKHWSVQGDDSLAPLLRGSGTETPLRKLVFETWCADQAYDLFGTVWAAS
jgi:hypothetical protein